MATVLDPRNPIKARKATRPAHGVCRWITKPNAERAGGVLAINGTAYEVLPVYDGEALAGYRLLKADGAMYDLPADLSGCDCPDHCYHPERPGGCKHMGAMRAALAALAK
ncbi:MAG TPA: hypothetical protein VJ739_19850 [Gemmataceae bacterium]|nr:hypothetical protein [Gemmataceae bacterium]